MNKTRLLRLATDLIVIFLGLFSLASPFFFTQARDIDNQAASFPIMVSLIILLCLMIVIFEAQTSLLDSKMIAFLAVLTAINAGLRFLENAIPGPGGFSPTFFLIILSGYYFGSRIGFLVGAMTLLVSAIITGGIGPWLPGQMITAGWVGQSAILVTFLVNKFAWRGKPVEIILLKRIRWFVGHIVWGNHEPVVLAFFRRRRWADFFSQCWCAGKPPAIRCVLPGDFSGVGYHARGGKYFNYLHNDSVCVEGFSTFQAAFFVPNPGRA